MSTKRKSCSNQRKNRCNKSKLCTWSRKHSRCKRPTHVYKKPKTKSKSRVKSKAKSKAKSNTMSKQKSKIAKDDETLKRVYGKLVPITWLTTTDIKRITKSPKSSTECMKRFNKIFVSNSYRRIGKHLCKELFKVGMYKPKKHRN